MGMLCFKNGSLARERVRDEYCNGDWSVFNSLLIKDSSGCMGAFHYEPEIQPKHSGVVKIQSGEKVQDFSDKSVNARVIIESQAMAMRFAVSSLLLRLYLERMTGRKSFESITICGGASSNTGLVQVFADVFQCGVLQSSVENAAGLGGAIRAMYGVWKETNGGDFDAFVKAGEFEGIDVGEGVTPDRVISAKQMSEFRELIESL
jgi:xylulokinase